ncbi:BON domain-containing protein [Vibrio porteresiae]|uniref:BON domain-containing protein n=1 Tax=Vibrio porteresiae DSM 19223 TaxID=1123496 RepID=A0ABZ0QFK5_9VIBR|nr:BON domain-containing protein [Vibrio porteresiae]WPC74610.1 BON domain-containing protein [Vibrio porteresiae DSM 19223]
MKKYRHFLLALTVLFSVTGCAGIFIAGAATTANLVTDPRSAQQIWDDNHLELNIGGLAHKAPYKDQLRITAVSYQGKVVLIGQAQQQDLLDKFATEVRNMKGVRELHNRVEIKAPLSLGEVSEDSWITTKVKSALLTKSDLNGVKVSVETEDKVVYLFGYVTRDKAQIATDVARNISGVKEVVRGFNYAD